ncbi:hypothetical protein ES707_20370 [subsurface metagenome]
MPEKTYTESEIRDIISAKSENIVQGLIGRLRDDGFFEPQSIKLAGNIEPDGSVTVTDLEKLTNIHTKKMTVLVGEVISALFVALFDTDDN